MDALVIPADAAEAEHDQDTEEERVSEGMRSPAAEVTSRAPDALSPAFVAARPESMQVHHDPTTNI